MAKKKVEDLTGRVFGRWEVMSSASKRKQQPHWVCICLECKETVKEVAQNHLLHNTSKMCRKCSNKVKEIVVDPLVEPVLETIIAPIVQPAKIYEDLPQPPGYPRILTQPELRNFYAESPAKQAWLIKKAQDSLSTPNPLNKPSALPDKIAAYLAAKKAT